MKIDIWDILFSVGIIVLAGWLFFTFEQLSSDTIKNCIYTDEYGYITTTEQRYRYFDDQYYIKLGCEK